MINWKKMIDKKEYAVRWFANGVITSDDFQKEFSGEFGSTENPARQIIRQYGTRDARKLARKAICRRQKCS